MMSNPVASPAKSTSCNTNTTTVLSPKVCSSRRPLVAQHPDNKHSLQVDNDGGNQSDSSNSNSSLASSPRYNERYPRPVPKKSCRVCGVGTQNNGTVTRGSFVVLGSRTSLPPLNENCSLDATESQLALNLRRATRSTSWTNQKILDAIDGLNTCAQELDPCLALGVAPGCSKKESPRHSFEKFVIPKSISNLIMQSRSSGSVNPTSSQNRENSCYNFLSGITEDEDEEQDEGKYSKNGGHSSGGEIRLNMTPTTAISTKEAQDDLMNEDDKNNHEHYPVNGRQRQRRNLNVTRISMNKVVSANANCLENVISNSDTNAPVCTNLENVRCDKCKHNTQNQPFQKVHNESPMSTHHLVHNVHFKDDDVSPE